jgi:hypothetical protein
MYKQNEIFFFFFKKKKRRLYKSYYSCTAAIDKSFLILVKTIKRLKNQLMITKITNRINLVRNFLFHTFREKT